MLLNMMQAEWRVFLKDVSIAYFRDCQDHLVKKKIIVNKKQHTRHTAQIISGETSAFFLLGSLVCVCRRRREKNIDFFLKAQMLNMLQMASESLNNVQATFLARISVEEARFSNEMDKGVLFILFAFPLSVFKITFLKKKKNRLVGNRALKHYRSAYRYFCYFKRHFFTLFRF